MADIVPVVRVRAYIRDFGLDWRRSAGHKHGSAAEAPVRWKETH